jgi:hypothetical protein
MGERGTMTREYDPLEYIRTYYRVPAVVGRVVRYKEKRGVISGASGPHVKAWFDGEKSDVIVHPRDLEWTNEMGRLPRLTRSQRNYRAFLHSETNETFIEFLRNPYWNDLRART